jgi:hypothetical protein
VAFKYLFGPHAVIWKLEPQQRGAPHFHLLIFRPESWDEEYFCQWVGEAWHDIAGLGDRRHLLWHLGQLPDPKNVPCVQRVKDFEGVGRYAGKYCAKTFKQHATWKWPGRFWGTWHAELLPITLHIEEVSRREAVQVTRVARRWLRHQISGRVRVEIPGSVDRETGECVPRQVERWTLAAAKGFFQGDSERCGISWRPIHCGRSRRRAGGCTVFVPSIVGDRMLAWAKERAACECRSDERVIWRDLLFSG